MEPVKTTRASRFNLVYAGLGTALGILTLVIIASMYTTQRIAESVRWQAHTLQVMMGVENLAADIRGAEAAHRGFIAMGDTHFHDEYVRARDALSVSIDSMQKLIDDDNPDQRVRVRGVAAALEARVAYLNRSNALRSEGRIGEALLAVRDGSQSELRAQVFNGLSDIKTAEESLLLARTAAVDRAIAQGRWINVLGLLTSAILVVFSIMIFRSEAERRRRARRRLASSEERLRDFLDSANDLIQSSDPDGNLVYVNRALLATLGYEEREVIGRPSSMFFAPEYVRQGELWFDRIMAGETVTDIDTVYLRKDGRRVHVAGSSNVRFEDGEAVVTRTILRDVTQQHEVDQMKDEFVSIVSHELRTPLTSIRGALGLLANGMLGDVPERGKRMLDVAISNTDRLVRLINDILDVERIQSGSVPMSLHRIRLQDVLVHVEGLMRPLADKADVRLEIAAIDADMNADEDRIVQMITNLVSNAIKFAPVGSTVRLDGERESASIHLVVRDEGRGIPSDKLESVFERFQQVDATDAREKGGSGLGLAISRGIVQQHGGRIWAESTLGKGAAFHVVLPLLAPLAKGEQTSLKDEMEPLVLICDDDSDTRVVLSEMLTAKGYRVIAAAGGREALELATVHKPAVMLLDLLMPGEYDGWRTMAAFKERASTSNIPILILSGSGEQRPDQTNTHLETTTRMHKPVDAPSLVRAIEQALSRWGAGSSVLVVEDDADLARILIEFLSSHGLNAAHATDGREAVRLSQQLKPALIILDLMLPDTDGFAVVDWLRQHDRLSDVPIMVYTARDLDDDMRARLGLAPELLFTKSRMPPEELIDRVAAMVGRMTWDNDKTEL